MKDPSPPLEFIIRHPERVANAIGRTARKALLAAAGPEAVIEGRRQYVRACRFERQFGTQCATFVGLGVYGAAFVPVLGSRHQLFDALICAVAATLCIVQIRFAVLRRGKMRNIMRVHEEAAEWATKLR